MRDCAAAAGSITRAATGVPTIVRSAQMPASTEERGTRCRPGVLHEVAAKCHRAGITCTFSLIFALPDEAEDDRRQTLAMMRSIKSSHPTTEFHSNIYTPYPGAPNFRRAVEMGLREPQTLEE